MSGETTQEEDPDAELSGNSGLIKPGQDNSSKDSMPGRPRDRFYPAESRNMMSKSEGACADSITSSDGSNSQIFWNVSKTVLGLSEKQFITN